MIRFELPWPSAKLNPNRSKGLHWAATSTLRKDARHVAMLLTRHAMPASTQPLGDVPLTITFVQPDRRARDRDNLLAALKPSLDGVADALGINDSRFEPVVIRREYGAKPGSVRIEIGNYRLSSDGLAP
jgi:hypothetical protein